MRTRLDEIVEEIYGKTPDTNRDYWSPYAVEVFGKIAEACFRHGVEQCSRIGLYDRTGVQPAPAGEKHKTLCGHEYDPTVSACLHPTSRTTVCGMPWTDRRKGERRKLRWLTSECDGRRVYFAPALHRSPGATWDGMLYAYFIDRRSGKDRRKP